MGKLIFYGTGVLGIAAILIGCVTHSPIPTNIGFVLLVLCVILGLFSKER